MERVSVNRSIFKDKLSDVLKVNQTTERKLNERAKIPKSQSQKKLLSEMKSRNLFGPLILP